MDNPSTTNSNKNETAQVPWYAAYPPPRNVAPSLSREELLQWFQDERKRVGKDFVLVDLRRSDFETINTSVGEYIGGTIHGSLNLPAQSLYLAIPTLYSILSQTQVRDVVWYCGIFFAGSSRGRGPRAAGWFADYLEEQGNTSIRSLVLEGGIKGWVSAGEEYTRSMDGILPIRPDLEGLNMWQMD
ncbi:Uncharacterized protein T310_5559 [Rasamsonia emersonii CBS 393.64]|uniref:Rhodanese domain-containing protein n=1 Tax=Rasamsonia emersonii (strain ATCC 16479 / CBS 393.64 / IMI 116815) TaxID=1408163 RepID=A0A0F4YQ38_RASE3|nr:Uncharacterized protein T310_5559 [Rasamsonia emersonii CBS 393.64]KKA20397.1 Uncharacterized protein T310_5559 [Rasamsonia emersonii CBS 393.64]